MNHSRNSAEITRRSRQTASRGLTTYWHYYDLPCEDPLASSSSNNLTRHSNDPFKSAAGERVEIKETIADPEAWIKFMSEKHMNACNGEGYEIGSAILCNVEVELGGPLSR